MSTSRLTAVHAEVLSSGATPKALLTAAHAEILSAGATPKALLFAVHLEVLFPVSVGGTTTQLVADDPWRLTQPQAQYTHSAWGT